LVSKLFAIPLGGVLGVDLWWWRRGVESNGEGLVYIVPEVGRATGYSINVSRVGRNTVATLWVGRVGTTRRLLVATWGNHGGIK
jgi:hypothetical protein